MFCLIAWMGFIAFKTKDYINYCSRMNQKWYDRWYPKVVNKEHFLGQIGKKFVDGCYKRQKISLSTKWTYYQMKIIAAFSLIMCIIITVLLMRNGPNGFLN